jgi:hypothetical protein
MKPHLAPEEQLESLLSYFMDFGNCHLLFIQGLAEELRIHVTREEGDLLAFRGKCRCFNYEPPARKDLHAHKIYDKRCAIAGRETRAPGTRRNEEYNDG